MVTAPELKKGQQYYCLFDQIEVPAELVQEGLKKFQGNFIKKSIGVVRCRAPPHATPGLVSFSITTGNFRLFSEVKQFEYKKKRYDNNELLSMTGKHEFETHYSRLSYNSYIIYPERNFKIRIVERLERLQLELSGNFPLNFQTNVRQQQTQGPPITEPIEIELEQTVFSILEKLLMFSPSKAKLNIQDDDGFGLLHCACALGIF